MREVRLDEVHMKVTAIMPARGRPQLTARAVQSFLSQTYEHKELLILDDEDCPACPPCLSIPGVQIFRQGGKMTIAQKRNWLCEKATGELIAHFDSDDWSAPDRISTQVARLVENNVAVTGYHSILFYDVERNAALKYKGWIPTYALGTTLLFRRSWWAEHPFPTMQVLKVGDPETLIINGEDNKFVEVARKQNPKQIFSVDGQKWIVARIHKENTCPKDLQGSSFQPLQLSDLPKEFF